MARDDQQYRANWQDEIDSAALYRALAAAASQPELAEVYRRLAAAEEQHTTFWEERLRASGVPVPARRPGWRSRALGRLARYLGPQFILPTLVGMERADSHGYAGQREAAGTALPTEERSHARVLRTLAETTGGGLAGAALG